MLRKTLTILSIAAMVGLGALGSPMAFADHHGPGWGPPPPPHGHLPPPPYYREYVTCRSLGGPFYTQCFVRGYVRSARIVRQYSNAPCRLGDSWGYERDSVWVGRGCSGVFEVYLY